jgi:S1-C subfamily serine protease
VFLGIEIGSWPYEWANKVNTVNTVDWILLGALAVFAWAGWRQGFVAGVLSFAGFLGGGIAALLWLPNLIKSFVTDQTLSVIVLGVAVLASAILGQVLFSILGRKLRDSLTWRPVKFVDSFAGSALNVLAFALVGWVIASVLVFMPNNSIAGQIGQSQVLSTLDAIVPNQARTLFKNVSTLVGQTGIPRIVSGLGQAPSTNVAEPEAGISQSVFPVIETFTVRLTGDAQECNESVSGSGFYFAPGRLLTNAHVVAGARGIQVRLAGLENSVPGLVIYFDPQKDVAVIATQELGTRVALFARGKAQVGDNAAVAGYPGGGDLMVTPARISGILSARGENIYGDAGVERQVYSLRSNVIPGNSGGPLVNSDGQVLGLVFGSNTDSDVGYALTNSELRDAIDFTNEWKQSDGSVETGSCQLRE